MDMKLEVVVLPVADVDRAKDFYTGLGWRLDADFAAGDGLPGRAGDPARLAGCSVIFGTGVTVGRAGLGAGPAPGRRRHRGGPRRARAAAASR